MGECKHVYKSLDSETTKFYGDNEVYTTVIEGVFYCERCLDITKKIKVIEGE